MNWFERNSHWILLTLFVVTSVVLAGFVGVSALALLAGLFGGASFGAILANVAAVFGILTILVAADVALAIAFVVSVVRRASFPTSDRLASFFAVIEALIPPMRSLRLSERFEPTAEDRERKIKRRYVDGELSELEFEREMRALLDETEPSAPTADPLDVDRDRSEEHSPVNRRSSEKRRETERE